MQVFGSLDDVVKELRRLEADARQKVEARRLTAKEGLATAATYRQATDMLEDLRLDSPELFTIPTSWAKSHDGAPGWTAKELIAGFDEQKLERSKEWVVVVSDPSSNDRYYDSLSEAAQDEHVLAGKAAIWRNSSWSIQAGLQPDPLDYGPEDLVDVEQEKSSEGIGGVDRQTFQDGGEF